RRHAATGLAAVAAGTALGGALCGTVRGAARCLLAPRGRWHRRAWFVRPCRLLIHVFARARCVPTRAVAGGWPTRSPIGGGALGWRLLPGNVLALVAIFIPVLVLAAGFVLGRSCVLGFPGGFLRRGSCRRRPGIVPAW